MHTFESAGLAVEEQKSTGVIGSRLARTAKFGSLVGGQSAKWMATSAANKLRSPERSQEATSARACDLAEQLVKQLGQMKGAAMKIGQVLSAVDFSVIEEGDREAFKARLAQLRDSAPTVSFKEMRKVLEQDLEGPLEEFFSEFDEKPVAAASIGQVYRARTEDGDDVAVKIQYPGLAESVETDMRNVKILIPLVKKLAPGIDAKALLAELRERISEELDFELEAANQREVYRLFRGHPNIQIPKVFRSLSSRRVLVTEFVEGRRFEEIRDLPEAERDRYGEIAFRFFFGLMSRESIACGDPHPGNLLFPEDGRVCFLDFGLIRRVPADYLAGERSLAQAIIAGDAEGTHRSLSELGYLPSPAEFEAERLLDQLRSVGEWYFEPGFRRIDPAYVSEAVALGTSQSSRFYDYLSRQTMPPPALLMRRMEALLFTVLGEMKAGADWATIGAEYMADRPPSTELGEADARFLAERG